MYYLWLAFSLSVLVTDFVALADTNLPSLQRPKLSCHGQEKFALLQFKQSFDLNCLIASGSSAYPKVKSWQEAVHVANGTGNGDCCNWDGVKCDAETGHVIGLNLSSSCLYGTFPPNSTLFSLHHLRELDLSNNNFNYSRIPSAIGSLYKLTHLDLSESVFSGQVPLEMSMLSSLSSLDLSFNGFPTSHFSHQFDLKLHDLSLEKLVHNLTHLTQLNLNWVDISSTAPFILNNRTSLRYLFLSGCNLLGEFPSSLFQLPNLEAIGLMHNLQLGGHLPDFHSNSPLSELALSGTSFSGELPASLGKLSSLSDLQLDFCEFYGPIPPSIGNLTELTSIFLDTNYFSGELPSSIMNLTQLEVLSLSHSSINVGQEIRYSWLPKQNTLTFLGLSSMNLGNKILPALSNLTRLAYLYLRDNQLTSSLPSSFMNMSQLETLDLSENQLQGPIPSQVSHLARIRRLSLSFRGSAGKFDSFLSLPYLQELSLSGVNLAFSPNLSMNSTFPKLDSLELDSCNLTEFPKVLRFMDGIEWVDLPGNNIQGDIPQWFVNLTRDSLLTLDLSNNMLTGFEQPSRFLPWNNLGSLNFNGNKLSGPLPYPPSSMQVYQVSNNQFYGGIPKNFCHSSSLTCLDLSINKLSGHIPGCIGHELGRSLQVLNLQDNKFGGTIPRTFPKSCQLNMINLSKNKLEGNLPKSLSNCTMLQVLDVGRNRIKDTFPSWLGSLPKLQVLVLRHNSFHGKISAPSLGHHFPSLRIIDLSYNFHSGNLPSRYIQSWLAMAVSAENMSIPSSSSFRIEYAVPGDVGILDLAYNYEITITNKGSETVYKRLLTVLRVIDFSRNNFSGTIPECIGDLRGLQALNLSNNNLIGGIPSSLANITDMESMDLSRNRLSGEIPQNLTKLTFLEVFNVSHNHLTGLIPEGAQFNTFDNSSFDGNLGLCGAPLSNKCGKTDSPLPSPPQRTNDVTEKDSKLVDWIIRSMGCASGFIVGYVIGKIFITDKHHDWFMETFGRRRRPKTRARRSSAPGHGRT